MSKSEGGNILILVALIVILLAGVGLFVTEKMGITHLINLSSTKAPQNQAQNLLPTSAPAQNYQNPFDESSESASSSPNPFEVYENPFNNL